MRINPFYLHGEEFTPVRKLLALHALAGGVPLTEYTATGNPVSFETNVAKPLSQCLLSFLPVQSGTGDPSPDNVRPITGWTGAKAWRTGKNLLNPETRKSPLTQETQRWGLTTNTSPPNATGEIVLQPGKYTFSIGTDSGVTEITIRDGEGNIIVREYSRTNVTFTLAETKTVGVYCSVNSGVEGAVYALHNYAMLELGETATAYEPYTGQSVSVTFPAEAGTVYGGTLDLTTGVLTVDWGKKTVNDLSWTYQEQYTRFNTNINDIKQRGGARELAMFCSAFIPIYDSRPIADVPNNAIYSGGMKNVSIKTDEYITEADLKENYGTVEIVYPLQTPLVYQLTPSEIQTLIGTNVLWSDTNGDMEIKYLKKG